MRWQYFVSAPTVELIDQGKVALTRLPDGAPVALAETLRPPGEWHHDLRMWRVTYLGSDHEFRQITAEQAETLIGDWIDRGRLQKRPDEASTLTPERAGALARLENEARAVWRNVPTPPGAADL